MPKKTTDTNGLCPYALETPRLSHSPFVNSAPSNRISKPRTVVSHLGNVLLTHILHGMLLTAPLTLSIHSAKSKPQDNIAHARETNHGHGDCMAFDEAGFIGCRVNLLTR